MTEARGGRIKWVSLQMRRDHISTPVKLNPAPFRHVHTAYNAIRSPTEWLSSWSGNVCGPVRRPVHGRSLGSPRPLQVVYGSSLGPDASGSACVPAELWCASSPSEVQCSESRDLCMIEVWPLYLFPDTCEILAPRGVGPVRGAPPPQTASGTTGARQTRQICARQMARGDAFPPK